MTDVFRRRMAAIMRKPHQLYGITHAARMLVPLSTLSTASIFCLCAAADAAYHLVPSPPSLCNPPPPLLPRPAERRALERVKEADGLRSSQRG